MDKQKYQRHGTKTGSRHLKMVHHESRLAEVFFPDFAAKKPSVSTGSDFMTS
jgi:hypothetical protein